VFDRIFLYVEDRQTSGPAAELALSMAKPLGSRLFAAYVIDTAGLPKGSARQKKLSDVEEQAWQILYEIEDDAFEREIRISLLLDQGDPLERLLDLARSYQARLLVAGAGTRLPLSELLKRSPVPVVLATAPVNQTSESHDRAVRRHKET
jgi:nucleotide-binding universal stress UspA family protein